MGRGFDPLRGASRTPPLPPSSGRVRGPHMCGPQLLRRYRLSIPTKRNTPKWRGTPILDKNSCHYPPAIMREDNISQHGGKSAGGLPGGGLHLVVNDCSTDRSAEILKEHHYPFLDLPVNLGIGGNVQCGYLYAVHHLAMMSPCRWTATASTTRLPDGVLRPVLNGECDMCIGSRFY